MFDIIAYLYSAFGEEMLIFFRWPIILCKHLIGEVHVVACDCVEGACHDYPLDGPYRPGRLQ